MLRLGQQPDHGLRVESYTSLVSMQSISKQAIIRRLGRLTDDEMRGVSERLIRALEIDVSAYVAQLHPGATREPATGGQEPLG